MKRGKKRGISNVPEDYSERPDTRKEVEMDFEDPFEDELESEEEEMEYIDEDSEDGEDHLEFDEEEEEEDLQPWLPGVNQLNEGEVLEYDSKAYEMLHRTRAEWPCLSFDILTDKLGHFRHKYPHTSYIVAGSQAEKMEDNKIYVMKMSKLSKTKYDEDDEDEDNSDDDEYDEDAEMESRTIPHYGGVNRIRAMPQNTNIVATFSESMKVHIWDLANPIKSLDTPLPTKQKAHKPIFTFGGHKEEGFALDWSPVSEGTLATGDCASALHVWHMNEGGTWSVSNSLRGHKDSIEDIQWSPGEASVFATCSVDRSIKIWDAREGKMNAIRNVMNAHASDINVISWNHQLKHLLASGGDDGAIKIWDMRRFGEKDVQPDWVFEWHHAPITSIEWNRNDAYEIVASSEDNTVSLWDFSLTKDPNETSAEVPPQLLFIHQGQNHIKEVHFHKQIGGMLISTAEDGFNLWKPSLSDS